MKLPVILDCDPGIDDAVAIALLCAADTLDLKMVTTCAGNQLPEKTYRNARNLLSLMGREDIPVYPGAPRPLLRELLIADDVHGDTGLGTVLLPESRAEHTDLTAIQAMRNYLEQSRENITIAATGPLTNLALLVSAFPELKGHISQIVWMGGAFHGGNVTPTGEFNAVVDPEAAQVVLESGIPVVMVGLDVTRKAQFFEEDILRLSQLGTRTAQALAEMIRFYSGSIQQPVLPEEGHIEGVHMHDPCAVAYLICPDLFTLVSANVMVETKGEYTAGTTVVDYYHVTGRPENVRVAFDVDGRKLVDLICESAGKLR